MKELEELPAWWGEESLPLPLLQKMRLKIQCASIITKQKYEKEFVRSRNLTLEGKKNTVLPTKQPCK